jgi:hypothetical protein
MKVLQRWSEYYDKNFELQDGADSSSGEEWTMCIQTAKPYAGTPNDVNMELEISKLNMEK